MPTNGGANMRVVNGVFSMMKCAEMRIEWPELDPKIGEVMKIDKKNYVIILDKIEILKSLLYDQWKYVKFGRVSGMLFETVFLTNYS